MSRFGMLLSLLAASCALAPARVPFPARQAGQLRLRDTEDVAAMRRHAWAVFGRVTQAERAGQPAFAGWSSLQRAFPDGTPIAARPFRMVGVPETIGIPLRQASGAPLLSQVLFNPPAFRHIRSRRLFSRARLDRLNAGFGAARPLSARRIAPFPRDSMAVKLIWAVVHARGLTPLSVWDGPDADAGAHLPESWPRVVLVDPGGGQSGSRAVTLGGRRYDARIVPLERFYHIRLDAADIGAVRAIDASAAPGDYAVLLAMHLTTKEIPDWIWATFWWHDRPDAGAFAADRPAALAGPWRNYLMDVAYSMTTPAEADGTPNAAFNPYIEVFPAGTRSNCMACHQGAVWTPSGAPPFLPVTRGPRRADDPLFRTGTRLDFMWSIATEAR